MNRFVSVVAALITIVVIGICGYGLIEGWPIGDSIYMTLITVATVGYCEVHELSGAGRAFTSALVLVSIGFMVYASASLTSYIVEMDLNGAFLRRRTLRMIQSLKDHVIICGTEPVVNALIERLARKRVAVVVVDTDTKRLEEIRTRFRRVLTVEGSPTSELSLANAGVLEAKTVIAATSSDVDNLLIGITCRDIGPDVQVYALSIDPVLGNRMRKVGIQEVVNPAELISDHVAALVFNMSTKEEAVADITA